MTRWRHLRRASLAGLIGAGLLLWVPAAAAVTITLGPTDLSVESNSFEGNPGSTTVLHTALTDGLLVTPSDGVITEWRSNSFIDEDNSQKVRVMRPAPGGQFTAISSSAAGTSYDGITPNPTNLPIQVGDSVGLLLVTTPGNSNFVLSDGTHDAATFSVWEDTLVADGSTGAPTSMGSQEALDYNATVELTPPVVTGVSPAAGLPTGGETVTITGDHLAVATGVAFGGVPAAGFSGTNTQITAVAPPQAVGTVDVRVTTAAGTSEASPAGRYAYAEPVLVVPDTIAPALTALKLSPSRFAAAQRGPSIAATPIGTTVAFSLSEPSTVVFRVERARRGRRVGGRCVKPRRANRGKPRCTRWVGLPGSFTVGGGTGANSFKFRGRLDGKRLRPGRHRLVGRATDPALNTSGRERRKFRIVRP